MPNYCSNTIYISGPTPDIDDFLERIPRDPGRSDRGHDLLAAFVPPDEDYSNCKELWGTSQEVMDVSISTERFGAAGAAVIDALSYRTPPAVVFDELALEQPTVCESDSGLATLVFLSAWSPPVEAFEVIASQYPTLRFFTTWYESGLGFCGAAAMTGDSVAVHDAEMPDFSDCTDVSDCRHIPAEAECCPCREFGLEVCLLETSMQLMCGLLEPTSEG